MTTLIYPYETLGKGLTLTVQLAEVESGGALRPFPSTYRDDEQRALHAYSIEDDWKAVRLTVQVEAGQRDIARLEEMGVTPRLSIVSHCSQTNVRQSSSTQRSELGPSTWTSIIDLDRRHFRGSVRVGAVLFGDMNGRQCRYLGTGDPWTIYFDRSDAPPLKGALPVKWIDFSDGLRPHLRPYINEAVYADLEEADPTVYLNKKFENLPQLFADPPRPTGTRLAMLELERMGIAKSVWLALFQASVAGILTNERDEPDWPAVGWQTAVLKQLLPRTYPGLTADAALRMAASQRNSEGTRQLESRALAIISKDILKEGRSIRQALRILQRAPEGETE